MAINDEHALTNQSRFLETLDIIQSELVSREVDYRIIGGVATNAWIEAAQPGSTSTDFDRVNAYTADQRVPDVDLIVPRADVATAQALRAELLSADFPVKLGVAAAVNHFDFRPDEEFSYLTHGSKVRLPVSTKLLQAQEVPLFDRTIVSLSPKTLFHTYQTCGGIIRQKDLPRLRALKRSYPVAEDEFSEADYSVFHAFIKERAKIYPHFVTLARAKDLAERKLPGKAYNRLLHIGLNVIDRLHIPIR